MPGKILNGFLKSQGLVGFMLIVLGFGLCAKVFAYLPNITILDKEAIAGLTDDKLIDAYIDVVVELQANEAFHKTSGFSPKEYESYKELLRYRILLLREIDKRKLEAPRVDETLR